jgi:hypothetical protein
MPGVNEEGTRGPIIPAFRNPGGGGMIGAPLGMSVGCGERASG